MTLTPSRSLARIGHQMRWFMWWFGAPLDPRWEPAAPRAGSSAHRAARAFEEAER